MTITVDTLRSDAVTGPTPEPRAARLRPRPCPSTYDDVVAAAGRIAGAVERTPSAHSRTLSAVARLHGRREVREPAVRRRLQGAGRAQQAARSSTTASGPSGVVAMSAGNHAQAVAYHATRLGIDATIVMPDDDPVREGAAHPRAGRHAWCCAATGLAEAEAEARRLAADGGPHLRPPLRRPAPSSPARAPAPSSCSPTTPTSTRWSCPSAAAGCWRGWPWRPATCGPSIDARRRADRALPGDGRPRAPHDVRRRRLDDRRGHRGAPPRRPHRRASSRPSSTTSSPSARSTSRRPSTCSSRSRRW